MNRYYLTEYSQPTYDAFSSNIFTLIIRKLKQFVQGYNLISIKVEMWAQEVLQL
jgi:hypothetical protein